MLHVSIRSVRPGKEGRLRAWLEELNERADEVRATFDAEGVRAEKAYVLETESGSVLVFVSEADDSTRARAAFAESTHAIDEEHRRVMAECVGPGLVESPVYDVAL